MTNGVPTVELYEEEEESFGSDDRLIAGAAEAVLYATDWTIETIVNQLKRQSILLNPRFQRRDAWTLRKKSAFIESILLNLPVPQIVLAESKGKRGEFLVLDGKQRLLTLLQFFELGVGKNNSFKLTGLELLKELNGFNFSQMQAPDNENALRQLLTYTVRSVVIRNWPTADYLDVVFVRLNQNSVRLSPQELRQALFPGPFLERLDDFSFESQPLKKLLGNGADADFRMRDIELLVRYIGFRHFLTEYSGDLKHFLDITCQRLNAEWANAEAEVTTALTEFNESVSILEGVFGDRLVARKWNGTEFEFRLNRALLDAHLFYLRWPEVRKAYLKNPEIIVQAVKDLCDDQQFLSSIEATTKSLSAVGTRLFKWGEFLRSITGYQLPLPRMTANNRLELI